MYTIKFILKISCLIDLCYGGKTNDSGYLLTGIIKMEKNANLSYEMTQN